MAIEWTKQGDEGALEPGAWEILMAIGLALVFVLATRLPFARTGPIESDEWQFVERMNAGWLPAHHTLFQAAGKGIGLLVGGHYRGLVALDMGVSALALVSLWWWLRALVRPEVATASVLAVGVSPLFWSLGEMAGNYTMIPLVGSFLLGVAYRGWRDPKTWHPYASSVVLAVGTGYREDIGTYLLPILGVIVWRHRWRHAVAALTLFTVLNLAWLVPMLREVGGWSAWRALSADFAYSAGYKNSVWNLGLVDAPIRYGVKLILALGCTLGPALWFLPRGAARLADRPGGRGLLGLLGLSVAPALGSHLLVHFGVAGYSFHYLPALLPLVAGGDRSRWGDPNRQRPGSPAVGESGGGSGGRVLVLSGRYRPRGDSRRHRPGGGSVHESRAPFTPRPSGSKHLADQQLGDDPADERELIGRDGFVPGSRLRGW